jgi:hypothetical protein
MSLCRHDIDTSVSVCTDCLPPGRVFPREQDPEMFGPWTGARFEGYCAACGTEILPGEDSVPALPLPHVPDPKDVLRGRLSAGSIDRGRGTGPG